MPSPVVKRTTKNQCDSSAKDSRFLDKVIEFLKIRVKNYKVNVDDSTDKNQLSPHKSPTTFSSEAKILHQFWVRYKNERYFSQSNNANKFLKIFKDLIKLRLKDSYWSEKAFPENILRLLQCLRIFLRDQNFQDELNSYDGFTEIAKYLKLYTDHHLNKEDDETTVGILKETANICQKLAAETHHHRLLLLDEIHESLVLLLSSNDIQILHFALYALIGLTKSEDAKFVISKLNCVGTLIHIISIYDVASKQLSVILLRQLATNVDIREQIKVFHGIPLILSLLRCDIMKLLWNAVWILVQLAEDFDTSNEIRLLGGIPLLIALLHDRQYVTTEKASDDGHADYSLNAQIELFSLKSAVCAALTELILNDTNAQHVVDANGIFLIAILIFPDKSINRSDVISTKCQLQKNAFRALRFLFSMERNRQLFKRLFLPDLFEIFIDVGHYQKDLEAYEELVKRFNSLSDDDMLEMKEKVQGTNQNKAPSVHIQQYAVYEHLGTGAFGTVYKVKRKGGQTFLAMKEISTHHPEFGKSSKERLANVNGILNECSFVKQQLHHMNIVKYHKAFMEGDKLYIIMDLIDGAPLGEHFSSLKEKGQMFTENRVWNIFIQLLLALRYMHKEKSIVHRDLSPNNLMLGENDHLTITDFGLARQKNPDMSNMTSMVGTILYSCPEILRGLPYGEKADIWAVGCILYQMVTLEPPFYSSNMLSLATRIVEAQYEPLRADTYSNDVSIVIQRCLTVSPDDRPDIVEVASLIPDILIKHMEHLRLTSAIVEKRLEKEKRRVEKQTDSLKNYQVLYGRLLEESFSENASNRFQDIQGCDKENWKGASNSNAEPDSSDDMDNCVMDVTNQEKNPLDNQYLSVSKGSSGPVRVFRNYSGNETSTPRPQKGKDKDINRKAKVPPSKKRLLPIENSDKITLRKLSFPNTHFGDNPIVNKRRDIKRTNSCSHLDALKMTEKIQLKLRPISAQATLSISPRKVREINDPVLQMLGQLHKIIFITQQPPSLKYNPNRRIIEQFKRWLFSSPSTAVSMKNELKKLMEGSKDSIDIPFSQLGSSADLNNTFSTNEHSSSFGISYEDLQCILESSLIEAGYYKIPLPNRLKPLDPIS